MECFWSKSEWNAENAAELASAKREGYSLSESPHRITLSFCCTGIHYRAGEIKSVAKREPTCVLFAPRQPSKTAVLRCESDLLHDSHSSPFSSFPATGSPAAHIKTFRATASFSQNARGAVSASEPQIVCVYSVVIYFSLVWDWAWQCVTVAHQYGLWPTLLPLSLFSLLSFIIYLSTFLRAVNSADTALQNNLVLATYVTLYLRVISWTPLLLLPSALVCVCVCLRLADSHAGLAVGGGSTHPALLPRGTRVPVLQLQESLLQARCCHAVLCRYVKRLCPFWRKRHKEELKHDPKMQSRLL